MRRDPYNDCFVNEKYDLFFSYHFPTINIIPIVAIVRVWTALSTNRDSIQFMNQPCRPSMLCYMLLPTLDEVPFSYTQTEHHPPAHTSQTQVFIF